MQSRIGNRDLNFAPHGVYPVAGEDEFVAIVCETESQWGALCSVFPTLGKQDGFRSFPDRLTNQDELDRQIAELTAGMDGADLERRLQAVGVPAHCVQNSPELLNDPQLKHLQHFLPLTHHEAGQTTIESGRVHLSRAKMVMEETAPTFSRDMMAVLEEVLGYGDEKIGELLVAGILE